MKVSIVIINYNDKLRIDRAINSALNQTYRYKEVIVVDDGSDNETRDIYKKYKNEIKLVQLERESETKRTPSGARNRGIEVADGSYICFLDSDNYYSKDFITDMMKYENDVMYCDWSIIGLQKYDVNIRDHYDLTKPLLDNYLRFTRLDHQCLLIKKEILDKVGHYDERLPRSQDCDMIVRLMLGTDKWSYVNKPLFFFEKHEEDQQKAIASIYGKTLWTLKNNINFHWLSGITAKSPFYMLAFCKAVDDFSTIDVWKEDYDRSEFKKFYGDFNLKLVGEQSE